MLGYEWALMRLGRKMSHDQTTAVPAGTWKNLAGASNLSSEQQLALRQVTEGRGRLAVMEGWAGTGKSYLLGPARVAWVGQGLRVVGGALSGRAAAGLEESAGISGSRTLASWEHAWERGEAHLGRRDMLVIDEASLVGTSQMGRVLQEAERGGAKVVLVGGTRQLQVIEAGSPIWALGQVQGRLCFATSAVRRYPGSDRRPRLWRPDESERHWRRIATTSTSTRRRGRRQQPSLRHGWLGSVSRRD